jgi:TPP-dependent pyruvate/acetoin dehydrogenase alpha subunit
VSFWFKIRFFDTRLGWLEGLNMGDPIKIQELDSWHLYSQMLRCRLFEKEVIRLWQEGAIPGEMHLSMGEEAIVVGIVDQLEDGDAMALDHRGTAPMLTRGVDPALLLKEFMGRPDGLGGGMGGHMHLFSPELMVASSGIVGASGPAAVGFAIANHRLRPGKISVAFFGEGAINQGMMLESFNLAATWNLPVMFVCKDNGQAILTQSVHVTGGSLMDRARGFGLRAIEVNGIDVEEVWNVVNQEIRHLRNGEGPVFIHASCFHMEGHFLGDQLLRFAHPSIGETLKTTIPLVKAHTQSKGAPLRERTAGLMEMLGIIRETVRKHRSKEGDPLPPLRKKLLNLDAEKLHELESQIQNEIEVILQQLALPVEQAGDK